MQIAKGLEGVEVDETAISHVDGAAGALSYRGVPIEDLVERRFTEVALWVLNGSFADKAFAVELKTAGALSKREQSHIASIPPGTHPMHVLQAMVPILDYDGGYFETFGEAASGLVAAAKIPQIIAQTANGKPTPYPDEPDYCARFLNQLNPGLNAAAHRAFSMTQILQIEHSFNASTFTARVIASTLAPIQNALAGAIGALHGPLHGGADKAALEVADEVGSPAAANAFVDQCIVSKRKVMGMGHREYRVLDPRARFGKQLARELSCGTPHEQTYETLAAIEARFNERMAEHGKPLHANIEFYKGLVYRVLGLTPNLFTACFAMARVFGYIAHFMESREDNRLIRPAARYVGPR
ncbi:MAG: citrate/2-methylcitrate synthase [Gammaproteobacteria bacterium]|nr:citrate/2-methylcitrate synthase [Gammaproteobacteria bacterium]